MAANEHTPYVAFWLCVAAIVLGVLAFKAYTLRIEVQAGRCEYPDDPSRPGDTSYHYEPCRPRQGQ